ncbi:MAG TPA: tyrosine-type recombinase/integrase [Bacteroidia bacterium]|nr:tyrosine-type recombinase/integrase [Bacteroidia bacterium]HNU34266.1 tyrosine-type recombinase/integrase [Bacteroidia bacterium]
MSEKNTPTIITEPLLHDGKNRIALKFKYNAAHVARVKKLPGVKWSQTHKCWHVPDNDTYRQRFKMPARNITNNHIAIQKQNIINLGIKEQQTLLRFENLLQVRKYSPNTLRSYRNEFMVFLQTVNGKADIDTLTSEQLNGYLLYLAKKKNYGESHLNMAANALKFYYEKVSHKPRINFTLPRPRKKQVLPKVIDKQQVLKLLNVPDNDKHKTMLMCAYAAGLRVSEVANLKISDIDSQRMTITIEQGKGKKDRIVMLSQNLLTQLRIYVKEYKPKTYLFEGQYGGPISARTIQSVFLTAKKMAGIHQKTGIHGLRHSFATHLHENGIDIKYIQDLLGHNSIKTTSIYTHVSQRQIGKIKSPFDE